MKSKFLVDAACIVLHAYICDSVAEIAIYFASDFIVLLSFVYMLFSLDELPLCDIRQALGCSVKRDPNRDLFSAHAVSM